MSSPPPSKRRRQCETCINCRSSRKQCDRGNPCRNCADNNRKCLYAVEFPYSNLSREEQAAVLERLLFEARGKFELLKSYVEDRSIKNWQAQVALANSRRHLSRNIRLEADMYSYMRKYAASWLVNVSMPGQPEWRVHEQVFHSAFDRNSRILSLMDVLPNETVPPRPRFLDVHDYLTIDLARAMVTEEEAKMHIDLYNDCYSFSALPDFISPRLEENGEYDLLVSSVMALMFTHCVNLHAMKIDNHDVLSHAFYYHTKALLNQRLAQGVDIMSLHATFNLMLYEAENGYWEQCAMSRQCMAVMIDTLHAFHGNLSVWQQQLLRHLFWAIFTADASGHNFHMQDHVLCAPYMHVERQRPSDQCPQAVDKLKEEYIYYRCRLAETLRHIWAGCYAGNTPAVDGQVVKGLEDELWALYQDLPSWIMSDKKPEDIEIETCPGYEQFKDDPLAHSRVHPLCTRSLVEVWMRRLRYHFLVEWHGAWLYLYQVFLPKPGDVLQLPFIRCVEHGKLMVDVLRHWADDPDFFDCYCYPSLRSLLIASHVHRYLLQSEITEVRHKGSQLLIQLYGIIERSNIYHMYKNTSFIVGIQAAFVNIHRNHLEATGAKPCDFTMSQMLDISEINPEDLYMFSAAAS